MFSCAGPRTFMPKNESMQRSLLDDVLQARPSTDGGIGIYDWVSEEPLGGSVASNTHLINREYDPIRKLLDANIDKCGTFCERIDKCGII